MTYVLIYEVNDYAELGGGVKVEWFEDVSQMHARANELLLQRDEHDCHQNTILHALSVAKEWKYRPEEVAVKYKPSECETIVHTETS